MTQRPLSILDQNVTTAPGDLPLHLLVERQQAMRSQFRHDNVIEPLAPRPGEPVTVRAVSGQEVEISRAAIFYSTNGSEPTTTSERVEMTRGVTTWEVLSGYTTSWEGQLSGLPVGAVVRYRIAGWSGTSDTSEEPDIWAQDGQGFWFSYSADLGSTTFAYRVEEEGPKAPAWVEDGVIYQLFLDRFRSSHSDDSMDRSGPMEKHGGTFDGIERSLGYFTDLGITSLYLSPFHPADTYHRYDSKDYMDVDPILGSKADLKRLTERGREQGIRFLMDFVPSHLSWKHPAFEAARSDRSAPTYSWFTFYNWPNDYRSFLGVSKALVTLNTDDEGARRYLIDSALYWINEYQIEGFRLDHAIGPTMDFWVAFRTALKEASAESFTVGEVTDSPDCMRRYRQKLDAVMDFPLARTLRSTFGLESMNLTQLNAFLDSYERFMGDGPFTLSFLDNHDMDRFLYIAGQDIDRLKMAATVQFALSPTPVVYYGTEIGMTHHHSSHDRSAGGDAQVRQDMIWDSSQWDMDLLALYKELISVRRAYPSVRHGSRETLHVDDELYVFARSLANERTIVCAVNTGSETKVADLLGLQVRTIDAVAGCRSTEVKQTGFGWQIEMGPRSATLFSAE